MPWDPLHPNHAIEQVVVTITFNEPVTSKLLQSVVDRTRPGVARAGLVTNIEIKGIAVTVGPSPAVSQMAGPSGFAFQRHENGRILEGLEIHPGELKYVSADYRRWTNFKDRFEELAVPVLNELILSVDIREVKVEYFDQFINTDPEPVITELLRSDSRYLPRFIERETGSFHCHVGRFERFDQSERRLVNLNVDAFDAINPSRRIVRILTLGADSVPQGGLSGDILRRLDDLHRVLKDLISDIITQPAADRIALNA